MEKNKKRQHYVWKNYLKPWALNNKIWCKRKGKIFNTSSDNIGSECYFYLTKPLNYTEQDFLVNLIKNQFPQENHYLIFQELVLYCCFSDSSDDFTSKNALENYYSDLEGKAVPVFNFLYKKDCSFLSDHDIKVFFLHFIALQYNRTKCMQERQKKAIQNIIEQTPQELVGKIDLENIFKALSFAHFNNAIANWLYSKAKMYFLETNNEFIASDQPIINIHSGGIGDYDQVKEIELYYPVTPHLALFFTEKKFNNQKLDEIKTLQYNKSLFEKSYEQVYAFSERTLEPFLKSNGLFL